MYDDSDKYRTNIEKRKKKMSAISIDTIGFKFNRDEAHERLIATNQKSDNNHKEGSGIGNKFILIDSKYTVDIMSPFVKCRCRSHLDTLLVDIWTVRRSTFGHYVGRDVDTLANETDTKALFKVV
jgi:hypothetical protein